MYDHTHEFQLIGRNRRKNDILLSDSIYVEFLLLLPHDPPYFIMQAKINPLIFVEQVL